MHDVGSTVILIIRPSCDAHVHILADWIAIVSCVAASLAKAKTLTIESPPSEKQPWTTATLESSVTRPQHVSLLFNLILAFFSYG